MERSALYRRALAPIMIYSGIVGLVAASLGWSLKIEAPRSFIVFWGGVSIAAIIGSLLLVRRQALKEAEPFWSPPTRRVTQAVLPALVAGLILGLVYVAHLDSIPEELRSRTGMCLLPLVWVILYGCAFHAAGFFMPRGMKIFGWAFILGGCALMAIGIPGSARPLDYGYGVMGGFFGGLHLAYGIYLYFTEPRRNET